MAPKSVFITAVKTGIGLEMVRQFATSADPPKHIFAAGRNLKAASDLVELANAHKNIHFVELGKLRCPLCKGRNGQKTDF